MLPMLYAAVMVILPVASDLQCLHLHPASSAYYATIDDLKDDMEKFVKSCDVDGGAKTEKKCTMRTCGELGGAPKCVTKATKSKKDTKSKDDGGQWRIEFGCASGNDEVKKGSGYVADTKERLVLVCDKEKCNKDVKSFVDKLKSRQEKDDNKGLPTYAIILIVVGVLLVLTAVGSAVYYVHRKKKRNADDDSELEDQEEGAKEQKRIEGTPSELTDEEQTVADLQEDSEPAPKLGETTKEEGSEKSDEEQDDDEWSDESAPEDNEKENESKKSDTASAKSAKDKDDNEG